MPLSSVFGSMAGLGWPVALAAVGAGIADMGLNIDQADQRQHQGRSQAPGSLVPSAAGIETLFNLPFLRGAAELAEVGEASETFELEEDVTEEPLDEASDYPA